MSNEAAFLKFSAGKLTQLASRVGVCLDKLTPEQIWARHSENENAIGNLVMHVCGNMRQWIGTGVAGQPDVRTRDAEFSARGGSPDELKQRLDSTVREMTDILRSLPEAALAESTTVQGYTQSKMEAIFHVVEHFSGHAGQIIFATKFLTGEDLGFYKHLKKAAHSEKTP
jgi:uncharacterized damage-inducible protein DinB